MKTKKLLFIVMILVLAFTAACGGKDATTPAPPAEAPAEAPVVIEEEPAEVPVEEPAEVPVEEPVEAPTEEPAPLGVGMDFVMPEDASNLMEIGDGTLSFQTALSIPDVMTFYRFALMEFSYTEREALTTFDDMTFNIVFDGHESGQAVIIQGFKTDAGVGVSIRLGDA